MGRSINFIQQVYLAWRMMILLGIVLGVSASLMGQSEPVRVNGFIFEPDSLGARPDSFAILRFTKGVRFLDSLKGGKLDSVSAQISRIDYGRKLKYNYRDPFDPYNNQVFYRHGQGKFWFFGLGMILLVVIMYFRAAYPKQFELRIKGIFNGYYFNELVNDRTVTQYSGGAGVVFVFSQDEIE